MPAARFSWPLATEHPRSTVWLQCCTYLFFCFLPCTWLGLLVSSVHRPCPVCSAPETHGPKMQGFGHYVGNPLKQEQCEWRFRSWAARGSHQLLQPGGWLQVKSLPKANSVQPMANRWTRRWKAPLNMGDENANLNLKGLSKAATNWHLWASSGRPCSKLPSASATKWSAALVKLKGSCPAASWGSLQPW